MSPTIRSKGGLPLMVGGQLVAGSQACCCENPPPPPGFCSCPGWCLYQLEILSPVSWGPRPTRPCEADVINGVAQSDKIFFFEDGFYDQCENPETCCGGVTEPVLGIVGHTVSRCYASIVALDTFSARVVYNSNLRAIADISVNMRCENDPTNPDSAGIYIDFGFSVFVPGLAGLVPIYPTRGLVKQATLKLTTYCKSSQSANCLGAEYKSYFVTTPITFTVSNESAGLTSWNPALTFDTSIGDQSRVTSCFNQLVDNFSATFRITSRPSCKTVDCSGNAFLDGMYVTFGNLLQFPYGASAFDSVVLDSSLSQVYPDRDADETIYWVGPFGYYEYTQYDPDGPEDNDGRYTRLLWQQKVEIVSDVIDQVQQWVVIFTSLRKIYDEDGIATHESYDEWVGKIACYEACEDLDNYIDAGDSVPMGEPYDIEYIGRTTAVARLECEPPPQATISIRQIVTC